MHGPRDCVSSHSLLTTALRHGNEDESDSLRALLFATDTPTAAAAAAVTSHHHHSAPSGGAAQGAIDLDLLLSRDSIDDFDEQHQQHGYHTALRDDDRSKPSNEFIRPEVTAVQAFLDEWQHDEDDDDRGADASAVRLVGSKTQRGRRPSGSTSVKVSNLITLTVRNPPKPKCIGTREREKEETIQLRREALQLELQLDQLRQSVQLAVCDGENAAAAAPLWKSLAERQRERMQLAGMENKSLKIAMRDQKRMAKSLHRILLNRVAQVAVRLWLCVVLLLC